MATGFGIKKVPEGSSYELVNGNLVLTYNENVLSSSYALVVPEDGFELDSVSGTVTGVTTITFNAH